MQSEVFSAHLLVRESIERLSLGRGISGTGHQSSYDSRPLVRQDRSIRKRGQTDGRYQKLFDSENESNHFQGQDDRAL